MILAKEVSNITKQNINLRHQVAKSLILKLIEERIEPDIIQRSHKGIYYISYLKKELGTIDLKILKEILIEHGYITSDEGADFIIEWSV